MSLIVPNCMQKREDQVMDVWISDVKNTAFHLRSSRVAIIDEDIILAFTARLLESYSTFIVTLNNISADDLILLNASKNYNNEALAVQVIKSSKKKTPLSDITCYNYSSKGH